MHKKNIKPKNKNTTKTFWNNLLQVAKNILVFSLGILFFWLIPLTKIFGKQTKTLKNWFNIRENSIKIIGFVLFTIIGLHFATLQVLQDLTSRTNYNNIANSADIVPSKKGNIFAQDYLQKADIPLTGFQSGADLFIDVVGMNKNIKTPDELKKVSEIIASNLNINLQNLESQILSSSSNKANSKYVVIAKNLNSDQSELFDGMRNNPELLKKWRFGDWINITEVEKRFYPQNQTLAQALGFSPFYKMSKEEVLKRKGCEDLIVKNNARGTLTSSYSVGERGLEQKYCSVLGGVNGLKNTSINQNSPAIISNSGQIANNPNQVIDGGDVYTTIDINIQKKAEKILEEAVKGNQYNGNGPKDGCLMVMEADTGNIMAMASYPYFDPNYYNDFAQISQQSFVNNCTSNDYEVGSVMKPLTVATALDLNSQNPKLGVNSNFSMVDYDTKGKSFQNGADDYIYITNAAQRSFQSLGTIGLKEIIRDSINTGIAEITPKITAPEFKRYVETKFLFGEGTNLNLPGDSNGDLYNLQEDIGFNFSYANFGFGQGFKISALQLMRGYTPLANNGKLVEPKIVSKIVCKDRTEETESSSGSCVNDKQRLNRRESLQAINANASQKVTEYMVATSEEGFMGSGNTTAIIPGHRIAVKSGTAQVSRPIENADGTKTPCGIDCNTRLGRFDHTFIGYNISGKKYLVMIKLAQPRPGVENNFASTTLPKYFNEMMLYTLEYFNVPKDK